MYFIWILIYCIIFLIKVYKVLESINKSKKKSYRTQFDSLGILGHYTTFVLSFLFLC